MFLLHTKVLEIEWLFTGLSQLIICPHYYTRAFLLAVSAGYVYYTVLYVLYCMYCNVLYIVYVLYCIICIVLCAATFLGFINFLIRYIPCAFQIT